VTSTPPAFDSTFSLPDAYVLAYPPTNLTGTISPSAPFNLPVITGDFGSGTLTPNSEAWDPAGTGSIKALYVMPRGTCSAETPLLPILQTLQETLGTSLAGVINGDVVDLPDPLPGIRVGRFSLTTADSQIESFMHAKGSGIPGGGFVLDVEESTIWDPGAITDEACALFYAADPLNATFLCAAAAVAANALADVHTAYNFQAEFDRGGGPIDGILAADVTLNGSTASGSVSGTIQTTIEQKLPATLTQKLSQAAEEAQAQPFPVPNTGAECANASTANPVPASCYTSCNLEDYPNGPPDPSSDPYAPFVTDLCSTLEFPLNNAITLGATALQIPIQYVPGIQASLTGVHPAPDASGRSIFNGLRCNLKPSYIQKSVPVCEVMALASRVNVFPDTVELVFFDADPATVPNLNNFSANTDVSLYSDNPGFGLFVALNGAAISGGSTGPGSLCSVHAPADVAFGFPAYSRRYVHAP
jgi:hypothetical protein